MTEKVLVAMSGGVDSSVAALLLQKTGYGVFGAMMKLFEGADSGDDAAAAAKDLGIPFSVFDLSDEFRSCVMSRFASEYMRARTPNPCVDCNRSIKFGALMKLAEKQGCTRLATGHYARIERCGDRFLLKKGVDDSKDQSYMLFSLTQEKLSRILLPLGELTKTQVRELARENGIKSADKGDSQDICFLPDGDHSAFIERFSGKAPVSGDIVDEQGKKLGVHSGISGYTVGQRRGLGVSSSGRLFVKSLDAESNTVVLGDNNSLFEKSLIAGDINLIAADSLAGDFRLTAKIRYAHKGAAATVRQTGENELSVVFDEPQRAITCGQYVVLYDGDTVVGGGVIEKVGE